MRKSRPAGGTALRLHVLALAFLASSQLGPGCAKFAGIRWDAPEADVLRVEGSIAVAARLGVEHGESSVKLRIQGVDLAAELGLSPPFTDASGVVDVDGDAVTVTGFSIYSFNGARRAQASLAGLSPGDYELEVSGVNPETSIFNSETRHFTVVDFFTLEAADVPAAGLPGGPVASDTEGVLANASLGQALAAPPVLTLGGSTLRSGHVEAAEALVAGGP